MKKTIIPSVLAGIIFFSTSCRETAFLSPHNTNANYYHSIPLKSDSIKAATYGNAVFTFGGANELWTDGVFAFQTGVDRAFNFNNFQARLGGDITLGNYDINGNDLINDSVTNHPSLNKFFGGRGFKGAINYVMPFDNNLGEWRVIGLETSFENEFGDYLKFRKSFSSNDAMALQTADWVNNLGLYTEFAFKDKRRTSLGFKLAAGKTIVSSDKYFGNSIIHTPSYYSGTFWISNKRVTGFLQFNKGTYSFSMQLGTNVCLSKQKHY